MNDNDIDASKNRKRVPPPTYSGEPQEELEEKLKASPKDLSTKLDVGSDESMDASDPVSVVQPGHDEPVPSSGSPDDDENDDC